MAGTEMEAVEVAEVDVEVEEEGGYTDEPEEEEAAATEGGATEGGATDAGVNWHDNKDCDIDADTHTTSMCVFARI